MKFTPSHRLYGLGAILLVALTICSRNFSRTGEPSFFIPLAVAVLAYLLTIRELFSTPKFPKHVILFGLALSALWHFQFLRMAPGVDDDIHRYVWDGRCSGSDITLTSWFRAPPRLPACTHLRRVR